MAQEKEDKTPENPRQNKPQTPRINKKDPNKNSKGGLLLFYIIAILFIIYLYLTLFGIFSQRHSFFVYPNKNGYTETY